MATVVTLASVKQIIRYSTKKVPDAAAESVIADACTLLDTIVGTALGDPALAMVGRWLAAHFLAVGPVKAVASEGVKGLNTTYQYRLGRGLETSMYGAQAMLLDTSGLLAAWNKQQENGKGKPTILWLGTADEEGGA